MPGPVGTVVTPFWALLASVLSRSRVTKVEPSLMSQADRLRRVGNYTGTFLEIRLRKLWGIP